MSDTSQGPGWWLATDGKWYPPAQPLPPPPPVWPPPPTPPPTRQALMARRAMIVVAIVLFGVAAIFALLPATATSAATGASLTCNPRSIAIAANLDASGEASYIPGVVVWANPSSARPAAAKSTTDQSVIEVEAICQRAAGNQLI